MNIWLINPYGPTPEEPWRKYSFTQFGEALSSSGHNVTWFTSSFSHHFKYQRCTATTRKNVCQLFDIVYIKTPGYKNNIGLGRVFRDLVFGVKTFFTGINAKDRPDLIIFYESPVSFGFASFWLSRYFKCALVFDQMDVWPELMCNVFSGPKKYLVSKLLLPVFLYRNYLFSRLDGVIALAAPYLEHAFTTAPSLREKPSAVIYNGPDIETPGIQIKQKSIIPNSTIKFVFAGSFGPSYDIESLVGLASFFQDNDIDAEVILAGDGPKRAYVIESSRAIKNLKYVGKLEPFELHNLYRVSHIGIAAYKSSSNVEMPDKFYDYCSFGLVTISSLKGEVLNHILDNSIGDYYEAGNVQSLITASMNYIGNRPLISASSLRAFEIAKSFSTQSQNQILLNFINNYSNLE